MRRGLQVALDALRLDYERVSVEREALRVIIESLERIVVRGASVGARRAVEPGRYKTMRLHHAARDFLALADGPQRTTEIKAGLLLGGYPTSAKNFYNAVHASLTRAKDINNTGGRWELLPGWPLAEPPPGGWPPVVQPE